MSERPTRFTRSMTNTSVNDHSSKEFSFCDPDFFLEIHLPTQKAGPRRIPKKKLALAMRKKTPLPFLIDHQM